MAFPGIIVYRLRAGLLLGISSICDKIYGRAHSQKGRTFLCAKVAEVCNRGLSIAILISETRSLIR